LSKEIPILTLDEVASVAVQAGYRGLCMRASQVGVHSTPDVVANARRILQQSQLPVTMLTGNFDIVYNNDQGPQSLRDIQPTLDLAMQLDARLIRVALKSAEDIPWAQRAADRAGELGIRLAHQCHTLSLFETVESIEKTLTQINRSNFGLIFEPANLQLCNQDYGPATIERLAPWIFNVYLQNQQLDSNGQTHLETWCRGVVAFDVIPIHQAGSIDFSKVIEGLKRIDYQGYVTVHQSATQGQSPAQSASLTAEYLRCLLFKLSTYSF
jgi:sugar phosphate isomerase/epimerase